MQKKMSVGAVEAKIWGEKRMRESDSSDPFMESPGWKLGEEREEAGSSDRRGGRDRRRGSESSTPTNTASGGRWATAGRPGRVRSRSTLAWPFAAPPPNARGQSERAAALPCMVSSLPAARHGSQSSINMRRPFCPLLSAVSDPSFRFRRFAVFLTAQMIVWTITNAQILNNG